MWTRVQLKDKAKAALKTNYWKIVLVSLIVVLVGGGTTTQITNTFENEADSIFEGGSSIYDDLEFDGGFHSGDEFDNRFEYDEGYYDEFSSGEMNGLSMSQIVGFLAIFAVVFIIVLVIVGVVGLVYRALITNPVDLGTKRFFVKTLNEKAEVKEVAFAFDSNYKNVMKILFIKDVKILLWSLLFVIPGLVKSYEYLMVPYLLAENPNLTKEEAFRLSKQMMTGQKWDAFVLEISFFWWDILSAITVGIVGVFYVQPYKNLTFAALYEELSAINGYPARAAAAQEEREWNIPF